MFSEINPRSGYALFPVILYQPVIRLYPITGGSLSPFVQAVPGCRSEVFSVDLEVSLRMVADRTDIGSGGADYDVAAVAAFPDTVAVFGEDKAALDVLKQLAIACFMLFFNGRDHLEQISDLVEAFLAGVLCETGIHLGPFLVLAFGCDLEIICSAVYTFKNLVPDFGVLFLIIGGLQEKLGDLLIAVFLALEAK